MKLQKQVDKVRSEIKTDSYSMSIGEWINLYNEGEIDIHPEFQRFFRWTTTQKTRFIESILLGIPIPPIFVSQSQGGIWDVVDGLQRLSTIYEFIGILRDEKERKLQPLVLEGTKYLPALAGKVWEDKRNPSRSLDQTQRLSIKREKLHVNIILKESGEKAKYELFQRLNTGGSPLSDQEVRNCLMVMVDKEFYQWLRELSLYESFQNSISLTDKALLEQYDLELALRFIIFRKISEKTLKTVGGDVGEYLTDTMMRLLEGKTLDFDYESNAFKNTFDVIYKTLNDNAFKRYDKHNNKFVGGFLLSAYETIALGLGCYDGETDYSPEDIVDIVKNMWSNPIFIKNSGSGVKAASRLPKLIPLGRQFFK